MCGLQRKIKLLEQQINNQKITLRLNTSLLKEKLISTPFLLPTLLGSVGIGYYLMQHKQAKQKTSFSLHLHKESLLNRVQRLYRKAQPFINLAMPIIARSIIA